eukprot:TRINITY_DN8325_c0_g1_i1.p1 TRINITY_DN8325_c0_g1~~TRINITY_DN8325_c0_g1_i1.p1  ORF type:complete len:711 (+),score=155.73 TRINITY_DN8325_c0_g1_i1:80-2212(+)
MASIKILSAQLGEDGKYKVVVESGGKKHDTNDAKGADPSWGEKFDFKEVGKIDITVKKDGKPFAKGSVTPGDGKQDHDIALDNGTKMKVTTTVGVSDDAKDDKKEKKDAKKEGEGDKGGDGGEQKAEDTVLDDVHGKALLVGINYVGQEQVELETAVPSVHTLKGSLRTEGFEGPIRLLADDGYIDGMPTRHNIEDGLNWLLDGIRTGDGIILYFSGRLRREANGTIGLCPADHQQFGTINSKEIISKIQWKLPQAARCLILIDAPGGGSISPPHQPLLPFRVSFPESDMANYSPPPPPDSLSTAGDIVVVSASSVPDVEMAAGDLGSAVTAALQALRGTAETPLDEAGRLFKKRVSSRFPNLLDPLLSGDGGGYVSQDFAAWIEKPIQDLQAELQAFGIAAQRAGPLQNIAQQIFRDKPELISTKSPPSLLSLITTMQQSYSAQGVSIVCESDNRVDQEAPFLPAAGWSDSVKNIDEGSVPRLTPRSHGIPGQSPQTDHASSPHHHQSLGTWQSFIGYISTGGDILGSPRLMTVQDAIALARRYPECKGFSFRGQVPNPMDKVWIYFKDKWDLHGGGWTSYKSPDALMALDYPQQQMRYDSYSPGRIRTTNGIDPWHRQRLVNFYNHYNPSKLPSVVVTLLEYRGHEDTLFNTLIQKYGPEPPDTMAQPLPSGWRLVESTQGDLFYKHTDGRKQWEKPYGPIHPGGYYS